MTMYSSVFPITREAQRAGIRVIAIVACDQTTMELINEMKDCWPDSRFAFSAGPGCVTTLIKTTNPHVIEMLTLLSELEEEKFAFLKMKVEKVVPDRFKMKLGNMEYFVAAGSNLLEEVPEGENSAAGAQPTQPHASARENSRPRHRSRPRPFMAVRV